MLDLDDIKDLVGHTNKEATRYYDKVDPEALALKLAYAETELSREGATWSGPRVSSGPAFIQAADRNSALQKSFHADQNAAIAKFGVVALVTGCLDQSLKQSGLDLLRTAAAGSLSFRDTHICPVNEECPEFVVAQFGRARACGQCPLGCKSIDHLPAISAKMHKLLRVYAEDLRRLREAENSGRDNAAAELYDSLLFTVNEFLGWKITEHVLLENVKQPVGRDYVIGDPEFVREHLVRNVGESTAQQKILMSIMEADAYPDLNDELLSLQANIIRQRLMGQSFDQVDTLLEGLEPEPEPEPDAVRSLANYIRSVMSITEISFDNLAVAMLEPQQHVPVSIPLLSDMMQ
ncbi:hypothetical protein HH800_09715 [Sphingobium yanoikuyae]|uniref:Uncharacterized protein n=1 Tax=Sphingobium yanoikuyae TaxID=13690 RepID=A0A6M4G675_SPHYA|nr:hypothetical protein [Sphingobium yanoikuyae]QJR02430.1 hypothetical protein HH800_09715 [Sphingobium yanoikuyae]